MKRVIVCAFVFFTVTAVWAADAVQPLNIKTGAWETTITSQTSGRPPIPDDVLARMTPEQRARLDAAKPASGQPKTIVERKCITKDDIFKFLPSDNEKDCKVTVVTSTASKQEGRVVCSHDNVTTNGTMRVEAVNPEAMKIDFHMTAGTGDRSMNVAMTGTGKWLGAVCTEKKN